ncbi:MAG TPA: Hpt domain-containing protein, partial [Nitrospiraceae bacterium]
MSSDLDRQALIDIFITEASEAMAALTSALNPSDGAIPAPQQLQDQYVWAHKIRGAAALYGFNGLTTLGALLEDALEQAASIDEAVWPKAVGVLRGMVGDFQAQLTVIKEGGVENTELCERWKSEVAEFLPRPSESEASRTFSTSLSPEYLVPTIDADVLSYFSPEADEYLQVMESLLQRLQNSGRDHDSIQTLVRTAHTLKGSAKTIGFHAIGDIAHPIEDCMIGVREGRLEVTSALLQTVGKAVTVIRALMKRDPARVGQLQQDIPDITRTLERLNSGLPEVSAPATSAQLIPAVQVATAVMEPPSDAASSGGHSDEGDIDVTDAYLIPHLDPEVLSYFAPEAQEYLESLEAQLLRLEKETQNPELVNQLFRTAHTLKGSAYTVGFKSIGDLTHYVEDFMGAVRDGRVKILPGHADVLLRAVDVVRLLMRRDPMLLSTVRKRFVAAMAELKQLDNPQAIVRSQVAVPSQPAVAQDQDNRDSQEADAAKPNESRTPDSKSGEDREVIRVSRDRLERLLNLVGELVIGRGRLEQRLHVLEQLSQQVLGCKNRLVDSVRSFEDKHTFTFQAAPAGQNNGPAAAAFSGLSDFGSLE